MNMQVALVEQLLLDPGLDAFAEQRPVGQHDRGPTAVLQQFHYEHQEEVGGSWVRNSAGKLLSMPSSSIPPNGGLVRMMSTWSDLP